MNIDCNLNVGDFHNAVANGPLLCDAWKCRICGRLAGQHNRANYQPSAPFPSAPPSMFAPPFSSVGAHPTFPNVQPTFGFKLASDNSLQAPPKFDIGKWTSNKPKQDCSAEKKTAQPPKKEPKSKPKDIGVWSVSRKLREDDTPSSIAEHVKALKEEKQRPISNDEYPKQHEGWILEEPLRQILMDYIDQQQQESAKTHDYVLTLKVTDLSNLIGHEAVKHLVDIFSPEVIDMIKLRKVMADPKDPLSIDLHLDYAKKTLSIPLNDPSEFEGGSITYAREDGSLLRPKRNPGQVLMHDSSWVHAVSPLIRGQRYHLFGLAQ